MFFLVSKALSVRHIKQSSIIAVDTAFNTCKEPVTYAIITHLCFTYAEACIKPLTKYLGWIYKSYKVVLSIECSMAGCLQFFSASAKFLFLEGRLVTRLCLQ